MKAIRVHAFGGPEVLTLEEMPDPQPGAGQIVVRVHAAGVNPVETYVRAGKYPKLPPLPYTPGADAAGTVLAIGTEVTGFSVGDHVYTAGTVSGSYAEMALCDQAQVHPLPESISFAQGAALGIPYPTAYYALFMRGDAQPGETVLIHGASGGVGTAAVQLAHARGLTIIATAGTGEGRKLVAAQGADHVIDHHAADFADQVKALTDSKGVPLILEMAAGTNLATDLTLLTPKGRVVVIGSRNPIAIDPRMTMGSNLSILGMSLNNATPSELKSIHAALGAGLENRTLKPVIGHEFPLAEAAEAHKATTEGGASGKIVLTIIS